MAAGELDSGVVFAHYIVAGRRICLFWHTVCDRVDHPAGTMRAHVFQHVPFEGLGSIEPWLHERGAAISWTRWFAADAVAPAVAGLDLLVVLGGPMSVNDDRQLPWLAAERAAIGRAIEAGTPLLGICLGAQQISRVLGARVFPNAEREIGWWPVEPVEPVEPAGNRFAPLFAAPFAAFHWHGETFDLPPHAHHLARSAGCTQQAFAWGARVLALQFHLETTPAAAADLITHCDDHHRPGRFVQAPAAMLDTPARFAAANARLACLLERLLAG
jgi:GMP synthase-like glutamine amidotransferase